jgi:hypothetical protein
MAKEIIPKTTIKKVARTTAPPNFNSLTSKIRAYEAKIALLKRLDVLTSSNNSVKILTNVSDNKLRQKIVNAQRTAATVNAKSGQTAKNLGSLTEEENKKPAKVVKINSAKVSPQGTQPALRVRTTGGLGGGGTLRNSIR